MHPHSLSGHSQLPARHCLSQCTLCFGVLFNIEAEEGNNLGVGFNALCALGFSSTRFYVLRERNHSFNALCALGFSSTETTTICGKRKSFQCTLCFGVLFNLGTPWCAPTGRVSMHSVLWGSLQLCADVCERGGVEFQCTLCFGVLFNLKKAMAHGCRTCFNALCALGFSSTIMLSKWLSPRKVSMHSVLWGSLQQKHYCKGDKDGKFQCTLCFGVLFNVREIGYSEI